MKVIWCEAFDSPMGFEFDYQGVFCDNKNSLYFFFNKRLDNQSQLAFAKIHTSGIARVESLRTPSRTGLPRYWFFSGEKLLCENCCLNLNTFSFCDNIPQDYVDQYHFRERWWGNHLMQDDFVFDEYTISHWGQWGYVCKKNGKIVWKFRGQGFLYTDIVQYGDFIAFGTDGQGGHFYIICLSTGDVLCDINTHGTNQYARKEKTVYLLVGGKQSRVVAVSLDTGEILDGVDLEEQITSCSRIYLWNDRLYIVAFRNEKRAPYEAVMLCIDGTGDG